MMSLPHQDKGYAWVILAAAFNGYFIQGSVVFTMTLMYQALLQKFGMTAEATGSVGATYVLIASISSKMNT